MKKWIGIPAGLALLLCIVTACSGRTQGLETAQPAQPAGDQALPRIAELDAVRNTAEIQQVELGTQFYFATSGNVVNQNSSVLFTSTATESAWALYSVDKADMEFFNLFVDFGTAAGQKLMIGVANYSTGRWMFSTPFSSSSANVSVNTQSETNWISPQGKLYFVLVGQGNQTMIVNGIRLLADVPPPPSFPVSGTVLDENSNPMEGVSITLTPGGGSLMTDANGNFGFLAIPAGNWTLTPSFDGWEFNPVSTDIQVVDAELTGVDFTGSEIPIITHAVSGKVQDASLAPIEGVLLTLNPGGMTTSSDALGAFSFPAVEVGAYTLIPSKTDYLFAPSSRNVNVSTADLINQNFTGSLDLSYSVSGTVLDVFDAPLGGVTLTLTPGGQQAISDSLGEFSIADVSPGSYTLTPARSGWSFAPANRAVTVVASNVSGQDFSGTENPVVSFSVDLLPIIQGDMGSEYACIECHSGSFPEEGLDMTNYDDVVDRSSTIKNRINRTQGSSGFMPKNGTKWLPAYLQMFQDWIDGGYAP
ncbi:carboxypeptidase regulatory-like domain-containing protein [bacterium]|nr:carboxypeptidase regulatory-like domain-containing protein [bacterium]